MRSAEGPDSRTSGGRRAKTRDSRLQRNSGRQRSVAVGAEGPLMTISPGWDADSTVGWPEFAVTTGTPGRCAGEEPGQGSAYLRRAERRVVLTPQGDNGPEWVESS